MFCRAIPYEGEEPYIFISYCHADKELIYPLIEQLSLDGYRVWYDVGNKPGLNWLVNIEEHLENCKAVIAFISEHSRDSNNCNTEVVYAMKCEKKVIPVLIDNAALPRGLRMKLVDLHYLERKNFPSDRELLKKCCEPEECQSCKDPSGSILLRSDESVHNRNTSRTNGVSDFFGGMIPVSRKKASSKSEKADPVKVDPVKVDPVKVDPVKVDPVKVDPVKVDTGKVDPVKVDPVKVDPVKVDPVKVDPVKVDPVKTDTVKIDTANADPDIQEEATVVGRAEENEGTVLHSYNFDSEHTVRHGHEDGSDADQTVRVSRNFAILIQPAEQKTFILRNPKIAIGRSPARCDVVIENNDSISKVHAYIRQTRNECYLEDNNSTNGTFLGGQQLEPGQQALLDNPAIFQLNDELLILLSGNLARKYEKKKTVSMIINDQATEAKLMDGDTLPLNRGNVWPGGTLSDPTIHRAAHALLVRKEDGIYLVDETPERSNGTYFNSSKMRRGESRRLSSGDRIRLGDTTLEFISIEIQP